MRLHGQKCIYSYILSLAGVIIFFLLIYLAGHIEQQSIVRLNLEEVGWQISGLTDRNHI